MNSMESRRLQVEKRNRQKAGAATMLLFAAVMLVCFFLTAFTISIPPPGEQYVAVGFADLGDSEEASGTTESEAPSESIQEAIQPETAQSQQAEVPTAEQVATQAQSELTVNSTPEPVEEPIVETETQPLVSSALSNALSSLSKSGGGGSEGTASSGVGNEGDDDGRIDGKGVVSGDNGDWALVGGERIGKPFLDEDPRISGVIRIKIIVDKAGDVTGATYDPVHSTISDSEHIQMAIRAAKTAKFTSNSTMPVRTGYLNIRFELE